jgi:UTP-glucose-1-phosphate uridylyltransferase
MKIKKAIIPAAKAQPKEMLPVVDKPIFSYYYK